MYIFTILCLQAAFVTTEFHQKKLVSYALPENRELKKALGFPEDAYLNFQELTKKYGYESEKHVVRTEDNYLLTVFRVLPKCKSRSFPVILVHGILDSSDAWIVTGPETGLAYILSNNCYDVWAANMRGNTYSRSHVTLNPNTDPEYWEFSFDETGNFDIPAIIDYVLDISKQTKVYYIGHSQGTTDFFVMGSLRPKYNDKIQLSIQLAPVAWLNNLGSPIPKFLARATKEIKTFFENLGLREIFAKQQILHAISEFLCQISPNLVCGTVLALSTGYKYGSITSRNLAVAIGHLLVGISVKTIAHFGQLIISKNFQRYDEGTKINLIKYGSEYAPKYNVSLLTSPIVLIGAKNDWLSTLKDSNILRSKLPNLVEEYIVPEPTWSHNNYLWGINATEYVYYRILGYFDKFNT